MSGIIQFIVDHQAVFAAFIVAVLDFIFAMSSGLKSNGILHGIYVFFQGLLGKKE